MEITLTQNKDPSIASASPGDVWGFGVGELGRPNLGPMGAEKSFCCPSNTAEGCADEAHYSTEGGFTVQCDHSCGERHSSAVPLAVPPPPVTPPPVYSWSVASYPKQGAVLSSPSGAGRATLGKPGEFSRQGKFAIGNWREWNGLFARGPPGRYRFHQRRRRS